MKLGRSFYARKTDLVAKELLGCFLVRKNKSKKMIGKIVETEAYFGQNDPASHACRGITPRNKIMFGPAGFAYIYLIYGNYYCLNFVTENNKKAGAVLIRALEPVEGIDEMFKNRQRRNKNVKKTEELCSGPGKLTQALNITKKQNGTDLTEELLYVVSGEKPDKIIKDGRVGIKEVGELDLRFYIGGNNHVSKK